MPEDFQTVSPPTLVNRGKKKGRGCYEPRPSVTRYVALTVSRDRMTVRRDDGGLLNTRQTAIFIGVGRQGSQSRGIESLGDEPEGEQPDNRGLVSTIGDTGIDLDR